MKLVLNLSVAVVLLLSSSTTSVFVESLMNNHRPSSSRQVAKITTVLAKSEESGNEEEDWRDFRAKLVMGEKIDSSNSGGSTSTVTSSSSSSSSSAWAYDAGDVIEKGSIILSSLEQSFGHGLNQQYFHKSVILVVEHDENVFTKGLILNRPTDLFLSDKDFLFVDGKRPPSDGKKNKWRMWFGGDVQWITSDRPELICLHSLQSEAARKVSTSVLKDHVVQFTSLEKAYELIKSGDATCDDFYLCGGYCGWGPGQLQGELERKSWHMVAADAQTVWEELRARQEDATDITGESTWSRLMERIGRGDETTASDYDKEFDNRMLGEWAKSNLVFNKKKDELKLTEQPFSEKNKIGPGTILRGSSQSNSPFLLNEQGFHQGILLITQDEEDFTVGMLLNRPWTKTKSVQLDFPEDADRPPVTVVSRFGGRYELKGMPKHSSFWFHCNEQLRAANIGSPLNNDDYDGIWKCGEKQVRAAIRDGIGSPKDFLCVKGLNIWPKIKGFGSSLTANINVGHYEIVPPEKKKEVFKILGQQELLTKMNMDRNIMLGNAAWKAAAPPADAIIKGDVDDDISSETAKAQRELADEALKRWMGLWLLDDPFLRRSSSEEEESAFE